ncbi:hypothetical protein RYH80_09990 [Halobaculum sp. MBLA0147]|uniref:hypothetical protein n=1 Tax=Halobaculum sp. MBLA0147 TaxID=3079934 RepID=UPI0035269F24
MSLRSPPRRRFRPGRTLVVAVVVDLVVRYGDLWPELLPVVSLAGGLVGSETTGLAVVTVAVYQYGWLLFEPAHASLSETARRETNAPASIGDVRALRLLVTGWTLLLYWVATGAESLASVGVVVSVAVVVTGVGFPSYCRWRYGWQFASPDGYPVRLVDGVTPVDLRGEIRRDATAGGYTASVTRRASVLLLPSFVPVTGVVLVVGTMVLLYTFPLPDLAVLGGVLAESSAVRRRVPDTIVGRLRTSSPERSVLHLPTPAGIGTEEMILGIPVLAGVVAGLTPAAYGLALLGGWPPLAAQAVTAAAAVLPDEPSTAVDIVGVAWRVFGTGVLLVAASVYAAVHWFRQAQRVVATLDDRPTAPARPPGLLLPAVASATVGASMIPEFPLAGGPLVPLWPLIGLGLLLLLVRSRGRVSAVGDERAPLAAGALLSVPLVQTGLALGSLYEPQSVVAAVVEPTVVLPIVFAAGGVYYPVGSPDRASASRTEWYAQTVATVALGGALLVVGLVFDSALFLLPGGFCLVGGVVLGTVRYYERHYRR